MKVSLSGNMMRFTGYAQDFDFEAATIGDALDALVTKFPVLRPVILDMTGQVRAVHRLFLNGEMLDPAGVSQPVGPRDELAILTAIAGG